MPKKLKVHDALPKFVADIAGHCRTDCYSAFNVRSGKSYSLRKADVTPEAIDRHLKNKQPVAVYLTKGEFTRAAALDVDNHDGETDWNTVVEKIRPVVDELRRLGFKPLLVRSGGGNGIHIWFLWKAPQLTRKVRLLLAAVLSKFGLKNGAKGIAEGTVEIFPKQNFVEEGKVGNPIGAPFARQSLPLDDNFAPRRLDRYTPPRIEDLHCPPIDEFGDEYFEPEASSALSAQPTSPIPDTVLASDDEEARSALKQITADDYDDWWRIGIILKHSFGENGFAIWEEWSATSSKYPGPEECRKVWDGLNPDGSLGIGTLFYMAQKNGWNGPSDPIIRKMNAKYGIVTSGNKTMIVEKIPHDANSSFSWISKFVLKDRYCSAKVEISSGENGTKFVPMADYWLAHRKASHYQLVDFNPSLPPGDNGKTWNTWTGFAVQASEGDWSLLKEHILGNVCQGDRELYEWLLNWMALGVQRPGDVIGTAVVLSGLPGTGKGVLAHAYGGLWGRHYTTITHEAHVRGRFNSHLFGQRLVFIDEGMWGGNRQNAGVMKTRVTEPYIIIEPKGIDPILVKNRCIYMIASNEASIVPADISDRRWQLFEVGDRNREDHEYFGALFEQLENGGREAMLYDLQRREISTGPDPRRTIKTAGLFEQVLRAQGPEFRYIFQLLDEGNLPQSNADGNGPGVTTIRAMYEEMQENHPNARYVHMTSFGRQLNQVFPNIRTAQNGTYLKGYGTNLEGKRSTRYCFPSLEECRRDFERYVGQSVPWSNDLTDWDGDGAPVEQEKKSPF